MVIYSNRAVVTVSSNVVIQAEALFLADGMGYAGGIGPGAGRVLFAATMAIPAVELVTAVTVEMEFPSPVATRMDHLPEPIDLGSGGGGAENIGGGSGGGISCIYCERHTLGGWHPRG